MSKMSYVLDTETTGLSPETGDRIIEIGAIEYENRKPTGRVFHMYMDPEREVPDEAVAIHGWTREDLVAASNGKKFSDIAEEFMDFVRGGELIIHNAPFDMGFLDNELKMIGMPSLSSQCKVFDTLKFANNLYPGRRNNLDALCRRFKIDNSNRVLHGALLDSEILSEVYLAMTQNQNTLEFDGESSKKDFVAKPALQFNPVVIDGVMDLPVIEASNKEIEQHKIVIERLNKESGGNTMWP